MSNIEKLKKLAVKSDRDFAKELQWRRENRSWLKESSRIAISILKRLDDLSWTQKTLAEKMTVSPQQISKILKGQENLTLETIVKLESCLGLVLIEKSFINKIEYLISELIVNAIVKLQNTQQVKDVVYMSNTASYQGTIYKIAG
jgi:transcriptional regulator with XRE-family HTH domain